MIAKWVAILLLASPASLCAAQQQPAQTQPSQKQTQSQEGNQADQDPLAAAARRAREQKKDQPQATRVWDNDNIPKSPGAISVLGEGPASSVATKTGAPAEPAQAAKSTAADEEQKAELQKELEQAKAHLKSVTTDLDIASRTYQLDQQTFYGNPNYSSDTQGAAKLKDEQADIAAKKQEVDDLQKDVDSLTAKLKDLESEATKPSKPE
jgi:uncharacterized coiled-coil protein SlyX